MKLIFTVLLCLSLVGCSSIYRNNPRNMNSMTPEEIERSLNEFL